MFLRHTPMGASWPTATRFPSLQEIEDESGQSMDEALVHACISSSPLLTDEDLSGCLHHLVSPNEPSEELKQLVTLFL